MKRYITVTAVYEHILKMSGSFFFFKQTYNDCYDTSPIIETLNPKHFYIKFILHLRNSTWQNIVDASAGESSRTATTKWTLW